jgi:hypothetical protein
MLRFSDKEDMDSQSRINMKEIESSTRQASTSVPLFNPKNNEKFKLKNLTGMKRKERLSIV